jgi:hypothetical protein
MMKKLLSAILALGVFVSLSACEKADPTSATTTAATTAAATAAATTAAVTTTAATTAATTKAAAETTAAADSDVDDTVYADTSYLAYTDYADIEMLTLGTWGTEKPGMVETNDAIYEDVYSRIENYAETFDESVGNGLNVYAYSFTNEKYIQIYHTVLEYPTYGTDGDLFGVVYDIENDDYITMEEFLASYEIAGEELTEALVELYLEENPTDTVGGVFLKAFNLAEDEYGDYMPSILFEMEVTGEAADEPNKGFYIFSETDSAIWELDRDQLFDPYSVDQYDPPLHCQEGFYEYYSNGDIDPMSDPPEDMMDILFDNLGDLTEGRKLVHTGEEVINGETCQTYALGTDSPEKFTAEYHFAISPNYEIYTMDILQGADWIPYE